MANYRYHVITPAGKEKKGIITASDRPHAMAVLKNDGNTVISIDAPSIWDKEFELPFLNPGVRPPVRHADGIRYQYRTCYGDAGRSDGQ